MKQNNFDDKKSTKKMKPLNILCFMIILLGLESNMMIKSCFAQSKRQDPFSSWQVTILNHMTDSTLVAHCKSKDDDLGEHVLGIGGKYYWNFDENLWQSTLFWCNFYSSKHGHASGDVFWPEDEPPFLADNCINNNCFWSARDDGIYFRLSSLKSIQLMYPWK